MPRYDRTGPGGQGPRTGGGFGVCGTQAQDAEIDIRGYGRGFGRGGRGLQRGFRRGFCFFGRGRNAVGTGPLRAGGTTRPDSAKPDLHAEAADEGVPPIGLYGQFGLTIPDRQKVAQSA